MNGGEPGFLPSVWIFEQIYPVESIFPLRRLRQEQERLSHPRDHHQDGVHIFPAAEIVEVVVLSKMSSGLWQRVPEKKDDSIRNFFH